ncbi:MULTISPECIES: lipoprotein [Pseudomonas]|uniref:Lipopeptide n=1 Tax=Pseudomonas kuykendallii TaxID=1007099 RepID=A0A2W5CZW5_9PSED|nr:MULTISPECIES: lipoprotein [Pseudomonas]MCQ4270370.1 lipoprotein [Pseudomonas kuykendallii]PZP21730.1 MAG: lipopeptide [Pseudomonas kuykendallii]SDW24524.1 lipoprotein-attachment site-containing protein [Pseudomonas kuykendallii]
MKRLLLPFLALVVLSATLAGCGQKGPLYHPDDEKAANSKDRFEF